MNETYEEYYIRIFKQFAERYEPEIYAFFLISVGSPMIATIGLNHYNNRYIAIPYIIFVSIMYVIHRSQENAKKRICTN